MDSSHVLKRIFASTANRLSDEKFTKVTDFFNGLNPEEQMQMCRILSWGLSLKASQQAEISVVEKYSNQPKDCGDVRTLVLAELVDSGKKAKENRWFLRIPLKTPLMVVLPSYEELRDDNILRSEDVILGDDQNFRPKDLEDFLKRPSHYSKLS